VTDYIGLRQAQSLALHEVTPADLYSDGVPPGASSVYAYVRLGSKTVATLYNSGVAATSGADPRIENLPSLRNARGSGPTLAQRRAEDIARAVGGTIVLANSAQTVVHRPPPPAQHYIDYGAVARNYAQLRSRGATI
jgi:hypothetical protein